MAGGALVSFAPSVWYPSLFKLFGWLPVVGRLPNKPMQTDGLVAAAAERQNSHLARSPSDRVAVWESVGR